MAEAPWLSIIGIGEDGLAGLTSASRAALEEAEVVIGAARHLDLAPGIGAERVIWPVPFADGLPVLLSYRGRRVAALASGDPFWFGAGTVIAGQLAPEEWRAYSGPSTFALAASRLGWGLERAACLGLHAAPLTRLRPHLAPGARVLALLRDGAAVAAATEVLRDHGFGDSRCWALEALGGPDERVRVFQAAEGPPADVAHPVALAVEVAGQGAVLPFAGGLSDDLFDHDGQITKQPMRALTLSALAPRPREMLWDIGAGSGSISIAWALSGRDMRAVAFEAQAARAARVRANVQALGAEGVEVIEGRAPEVLEDAQSPDAVFIGGGLSDALLETLWERLAPGARVVANAVTLESEALLTQWQAKVGGALLRVELSQAQPIGSRRGWRAAYPIVQWSVRR